MEHLLAQGPGDHITRSEEALNSFYQAKVEGKSGRLYVRQNNQGQNEIAFSPVSKAAIIWDAFLNKIGLRKGLKYEVFHASQRDHLIRQFIGVSPEILRSRNSDAVEIFERVLHKLKDSHSSAGQIIIGEQGIGSQIDQIRAQCFARKSELEGHVLPEQRWRDSGTSQGLRSAMKRGEKPKRKVKIADMPTSHFFPTEEGLHYDKPPPDDSVASRVDFEYEINLLRKNLERFKQEHLLDIGSPENARIKLDYEMRIQELTQRLERYEMNKRKGFT